MNTYLTSITGINLSSIVYWIGPSSKDQHRKHSLFKGILDIEFPNKQTG